MSFPGLLDLARVATAWVLLYGLAPLLIRRAGTSWPDRIVLGFLESTFVVQIAVLILGDWRLCHPGSLMVVYGGWLAARAGSRAAVWRFSGGGWREGLLRLWVAMDRGERPEWRLSLPAAWGQAGEVWFAMAVVFLLVLRFPLFNLRFLTADSYERALSLQQLVHHASWSADGSVALLAPVVFLTGVDAAAAVRWSGPILTTLLALAAGYGGWVFARSKTAAVVAMSLAAAWQWWVSGGRWSEPGAVELASLFWLLALARLRGSFHWALGAGITGLTVARTFPTSTWPLFLLTLLALAACRVLERLPSLLRRATVTAGVVGLLGLLLLPPRGVSADGPYQYEAAARVVDRLAREYPRGSWLAISPSQELPLLFGRGWHMELAEFVASIPLEEAMRPEFRLPYDAEHVFLFVEKRPLRQRLVGVPPDADSSVFAYATQAGRQSLEFQAARLAEAYLSAHPGSTIEYEDENLTVYHFRR